jgi:RecA-family ATPase
MRDGAWLDAQSFPPLEYAVPGIIPEGFGLLVAPPKAGKSWFVGCIGLACSSGGLALGKLQVAKRPTLYLALEDGHRRLQHRFRHIMSGQPIPTDIHVITQAHSHQIIGMVEEFTAEHEKALVVLDTLGKVKPPRPAGSDPYQMDYAIGSQLKSVIDAAPGASLLVVHHSRKAESVDFVDAVSGTQGIAGSADFILVLSRKRHSDEAVLSVTGRDINEAEFALRSDNGLWLLDGEDLPSAARTAVTRKEQTQLGDRALEVLALVNRRNETRAADLTELGIDQEQGRVYLNRLADSDRIVKVSRGLYKSVTTVTSDSENETHITVVTPSCTSCGTELLAGNQTGKCSECRFIERQNTVAQKLDRLDQPTDTGELA